MTEQTKAIKKSLLIIELKKDADFLAHDAQLFNQRLKRS